MTVFSIISIAVVGFITPFFMMAAVLAVIFDRTGEWAHRTERLWAKIIVKVSFVKVSLYGREKLEPGRTYVFAANHTSVFDILAIMAYLPVRFSWLAKKELFQIPVFGYVLQRIGHIPVDRSNPRAGVRSLVDAARRIRRGTSVVIFPEGTRSARGDVASFKRGGISLAVRAGTPIVPLSISGAWRVLPTKTLKLRPGRIEMVLGDPIPTAAIRKNDEDGLAERVRQAVIANYNQDAGSRGV